MHKNVYAAYNLIAFLAQVIFKKKMCDFLIFRERLKGAFQAYAPLQMLYLPLLSLL